eukprot:scaffold267788_cov31-Prasinocladus_malaysianus.AAC.5
MHAWKRNDWLCGVDGWATTLLSGAHIAAHQARRRLLAFADQDFGTLHSLYILTLYCYIVASLMPPSLLSPLILSLSKSSSKRGPWTSLCISMCAGGNTMAKASRQINAPQQYIIVFDAVE